MPTGHLAVALLIIAASAAPARAQSSTPPSQASPRDLPDPTLEYRPRSAPSSLRIPDGKIKLDVVVDDRAGKPALGLEKRNFKILDNNESREVMSFRAFDGAAVKTDPPVEVILVIDMVNLPFPQVATVREQIEQFLKQDGGHLKQPVTVLLLSDAGMQVQPRPSTDGNALAGVVSQIKGSVRVIDSAMGGEGLLERFQLCARQMAAIAENEARKPGRKLLIWVGPGWPMLNRSDLGYYSTKDQRRYFDAIVELSTRLREARMVVYSVAPASGVDPSYTIMYKEYLKGVRSPKEADSGNLALKVLATQTGGLILGPNNDLAGQVNRCVEDANSFYQISFDPQSAEHTDEFHSLRISVDKPDVTVRTTTGYYNQPSEPLVAFRPSTVSPATSSNRNNGATSPPSAPPSLPSAAPPPEEFETCAPPSCELIHRVTAKRSLATLSKRYNFVRSDTPGVSKMKSLNSTMIKRCSGWDRIDCFLRSILIHFFVATEERSARFMRSCLILKPARSSARQIGNFPTGESISGNCQEAGSSFTSAMNSWSTTHN